MVIDLNKTDHILDHYNNRPYDFLPQILLPYQRYVGVGNYLDITVLLVTFKPSKFCVIGEIVENRKLS